MLDDVSRLVGIDGVVVTGVVELGRQLEIEVELLTEVACCRWCGRASLAVKDRPVVRVRDLPIAGRVTFLRWRKRRYGCQGCERTFTETRPALPSRQRVSARFDRICLAAVAEAAHMPKSRVMSEPAAPGLPSIRGRRRRARRAARERTAAAALAR